MQLYFLHFYITDCFDELIIASHNNVSALPVYNIAEYVNWFGLQSLCNINYFIHGGCFVVIHIIICLSDFLLIHRDTLFPLENLFIFASCRLSYSTGSPLRTSEVVVLM